MRRRVFAGLLAFCIVFGTCGQESRYIRAGDLMQVEDSARPADDGNKENEERVSAGEKADELEKKKAEEKTASEEAARKAAEEAAQRAAEEAAQKAAAEEAAQRAAEEAAQKAAAEEAAQKAVAEAAAQRAVEDAVKKEAEETGQKAAEETERKEEETAQNAAEEKAHAAEEDAKNTAQTTEENSAKEGTEKTTERKDGKETGPKDQQHENGKKSSASNQEAEVQEKENTESVHIEDFTITAHGLSDGACLSAKRRTEGEECCRAAWKLLGEKTEGFQFLAAYQIDLEDGGIVSEIGCRFELKDGNLQMKKKPRLFLIYGEDEKKEKELEYEVSDDTAVFTSRKTGLFVFLEPEEEANSEKTAAAMEYQTADGDEKGNRLLSVEKNAPEENTEPEETQILDTEQVERTGADAEKEGTPESDMKNEETPEGDMKNEETQEANTEKEVNPEGDTEMEEVSEAAVEEKEASEAAAEEEVSEAVSEEEEALEALTEGEEVWEEETEEILQEEPETEGFEETGETGLLDSVVIGLKAVAAAAPAAPTVAVTSGKKLYVPDKWRIKDGSPYGYAVRFYSEINGYKKIAYCFEPTKGGGDDGNYKAAVLAAKGELSANEANRIKRALFYLYGGPGWDIAGVKAALKSCSTDDDYYVASHFILAKLYCYAVGEKWNQIVSGGSTYTAMNSTGTSEVSAAIDKIDALPLPSASLSTTTVKGAFDAAYGGAVSESITYSSTVPGNKLTFEVPSGVTAVIGDKEYTAGSTATVKPGQTFYFKKKNYSQAHNQTITLKADIFTDYEGYIIYMSGNYQNKGFAYVASKSFKVTVRWPDLNIPIKVLKKISGKETPDTGEISGIRFLLTSEDEDAPEMEGTTDENGELEFSSVPAGTYILTEDPDTVPEGYLAADPISIIVKEDDGEDTGLVIECDAIDEKGYIIVTNTPQEQTGSIQLSAVKRLAKGTLKEGVFSFRLYGPDGTLLQTRQNGQDGQILFDPISYDSSDVGKEYLYRIEEVIEDQEGVTYDTKKLYEKVSIEAGQEELLMIEHTTWADEELTEAVTDPSFTNSIRPVVRIRKEKEDGGGGMLGGARFCLMDKDENILEEWISDGAEPYDVKSELEFETTYIIRELEAPEGYSKVEDIVFTTLDDFTEQVITVKNRRQFLIPTGIDLGNGQLVKLLLLCAALALLSGIRAGRNYRRRI